MFGKSGSTQSSSPVWKPSLTRIFLGKMLNTSDNALGKKEKTRFNSWPLNRKRTFPWRLNNTAYWLTYKDCVQLIQLVALDKGECIAKSCVGCPVSNKPEKEILIFFAGTFARPKTGMDSGLAFMTPRTQTVNTMTRVRAILIVVAIVQSILVAEPAR